MTELLFPQINELNTLKRKSPSDLWKEDLVAFTEELEVLTEATSPSQSPPGRLHSCQTFLCAFPFFFFFDLVPSSSQKFEAKEKESAAAIPVKKAGGRGKVVKVKQETLPTPQGRRVVPRVTSAMKAEANKKADKKGEAKRGRKIKVRLTLRRPDGGGGEGEERAGVISVHLELVWSVFLGPELITLSEIRFPLQRFSEVT